MGEETSNLEEELDRESILRKLLAGDSDSLDALV